MQYTTEVCVSESERVVAAITQLGKIVPTRAAFHHDEVTLVLLVLNSLSNYTYIQSHDHHIITCCGLVLYE